MHFWGEQLKELPSNAKKLGIKFCVEITFKKDHFAIFKRIAI